MKYIRYLICLIIFFHSIKSRCNSLQHDSLISVNYQNIIGNWHIIKHIEDDTHYIHKFEHNAFKISFYSDSTYKSELPKVFNLDANGKWSIDDNILLFNTKKNNTIKIHVLKLNETEIMFVLDKFFGVTRFLLLKNKGENEK